MSAHSPVTRRFTSGDVLPVGVWCPDGVPFVRHRNAITVGPFPDRKQSYTIWEKRGDGWVVVDFVAAE